MNPVTFVFGAGGSKAAAEEREEKGGKGETQEVCLFPLLSWYHASWDDEPDLPPGACVCVFIVCHFFFFFKQNFVLPFLFL